MKERPILFSAPMVRAILDDRKTQTRRVVKPQPTGFIGGPGVKMQDGTPAPLTPMDETVPPFGREILCPYGKSGDRLWVRETWAPMTNGYAYGADPVWNASPDGKWRPSIHMPRAACRIKLEITSVRVERLQDISDADSLSEGITLDDGGMFRNGSEVEYDMPRDAFSGLWESINGTGTWAANPWVWAIEFRSGE